MRTIFALCAVILIGGGVWFYQQTRLPDRSGTFTGAPKASVTDLVKSPKKFLGKTVAVEGIVREQCESMGCFFYLHEGDRTLRVDLEEIAMNAPRREGHPVVAEGTMVKYGDGYQLWASAVEFK